MHSRWFEKWFLKVHNTKTVARSPGALRQILISSRFSSDFICLQFPTTEYHTPLTFSPPCICVVVVVVVVVFATGLWRMMLSSKSRQCYIPRSRGGSGQKLACRKVYFRSKMTFSVGGGMMMWFCDVDFIHKLPRDVTFVEYWFCVMFSLGNRRSWMKLDVRM